MDEAKLNQIQGRYLVRAWLGSGGMGVVYRALDRFTRREVALKRLSGSVGFRSTRGGTSPSNATLTLQPGYPTERYTKPGEEQLLRLAQEFQSLASLRHPNIISVLDYGFENTMGPFYTMELLDGWRPLNEAARGQPLERLVELLAELLRALIYLHRRRIIHRDVKPSNVLVGEGVKVLDFGLAVHREQAAGGIAGTVHYMAPEIVRAAPPSEASDLYAVGVMAYEMFAGTHLFQGTASEVLQAHLNDKPDLNRLKATPALRQVIGALLRKDPRERLHSAAEVIQALSAATGIPIAGETYATRESFLRAAEFVGREAERMELLEALERARGGRGGIVLVEGESGVGKSRLLDEIRNVALVRGFRLVTGQASGDGTAHQIWREPLSVLSLSTPLTDADGSILKLLLHDLDELTGRTFPDVSLPAQSAQAEVLASIRKMFENQKTPLLVILEDLHRAPESEDVLEDLERVLPGLPVLVIGSYRREESAWLVGAFPTARRIVLEPLARVEISRLATSMLGPSAASASLVDYLQRQTEGNVFFIVETVRSLAEQAGELDKVVESPLPDRLAVAGVDSLLDQRLALLAAEHQPMLELAAVLGREPDPNVLEHLLSKDALYPGLSACADLALMEVRSGAWRFSHDKFRERLLRRMEPASAARMHAAAAHAIEELYPGDEDSYPVLARHFQMAGENGRETHYATLAGRTAIRKGAYRESLPLLKRALELQRIAPVRDEKAELAILLHLGSVLIALRGWFAPEVRTAYDEAFFLAGRTGQESAVAPALIGLSKFYFLKGQLSTAISYAQQCLKAAEAANDPIMRQHGRLMVGESKVWLGEFARDRDYPDEIAALYEPSQAMVHLSLYGQDPRLTSMVSSAAGWWMLGYPHRALAVSLEAKTFALRDGNAFSLAIAAEIAVWGHQLRGDVEETYVHAMALSEISTQHDFVSFEVLAQIHLGWVEARRGQAADGVRRIRKAMDRWSGMGAVLSIPYYSMILADACLAGGLDEEGLAVVDDALSGRLETEERCYQPELRRLEGEFHIRLGNQQRAEEAFERALAIATEQDAKGFELRILSSICRYQAGTPAAARNRERLARLCEHFDGKGRTQDLAIAQRLLRRPA